MPVPLARSDASLVLARGSIRSSYAYLHS